MLELIPPPAPSEQETKPASELEAQPLAVKTQAQPTVRLLTEAEIQTLAPVFAEQGTSLPDPSTSFFVGTVDDEGSVTSFLVVQLRVHAEPMWIKPGHESVFRSLVHAAEQTIQERTGGGCDVFLFAPAGKIARLAEVSGMRTEPWVVYSKTIAPIDPVEPKYDHAVVVQQVGVAAPKKRVPIWQRDDSPLSKQEIQ